MEKRYIPVEECKSKGNFVKAICFKPKKAPIVCLFIGVLLMFPNNMMVRLLGVFFILMALAVMKLVKDFKVMDIFDKGIIVYGDREAKTACFVSFDEIESWLVSHDSGHDTVDLKLKDGSRIIKDTFEADGAYKALYSLIREKDEKYIKAVKDRQKPLSIPDALNNIRNIFFKKEK
ncbi:MAG: hypothetical protein IJU42_02810 [Erysipelotrichaceae bacterium]|nr:hypothetical protein [Erysipelotrichaceae bacterium]